MILIFGVLAVVFLVVGISFIMKGFWGVPPSQELVSSEEFESMQKDLSGSKEETDSLRKQMDRLAVELEESKSKLAQVKMMESGWNDLKNKEMQYQNEIRQLKHDLDFLYNRADTQADQAASVLENLSLANEKLKHDLEELKNQKSDPSSLEEIKAENQKLQTQIDETSAQFKSLEEELSVYREKVQRQDSESENSSVQLMKENERLKYGIKEIVAKIQKVEGAFAELKGQKENQLIQANSAVEELHRKIEQLTQEKSQNSEKIERLERLLVQKESEIVVQQAEVGTHQSQSISDDQIKMNNELGRLKQMNDFMVDQEKLLQLELTKYRARAVGLEAICQELRKQLHQDKSINL